MGCTVWQGGLLQPGCACAAPRAHCSVLIRAVIWLSPEQMAHFNLSSPRFIPFNTAFAQGLAPMLLPPWTFSYGFKHIAVSSGYFCYTYSVPLSTK